MAASFLRDHPDHRPFLLANARPTGTIIGDGSYGSVVEVEIPGAKCAAKKIHDFFQDPTRMLAEGIERASREFVRECQLMSTLRHPHIVQFLGVCFLPGSRMPALVMEKLLTSLHDVLDPEPPPQTKAYIPVSLKCSILHDVASGLSFLHSHSPPIIHRDLSARNVLLNVGMAAKIADLGMARLVPSLRAATMTKAPGAPSMPPEALEDESRYDVTIDIFSIGVLAIFTLSQTFPKPLSAAYMDDRRMMVGRTELQRRGNYMQQIQRQFRDGHPLIQMIQRCLKNFPEDRPTVHGVVELLEQARAEVKDGEYDVSKLALAQALRQRMESKDEEVQSLNMKMRGKDELLQSKDEQIEQLQKQLESLQEQIESLQLYNESWQEQNEMQKEQMESLEEEISHLQRQLQGMSATKPSSSDAVSSANDHGNTVQSLKWPLPLQWRKGKEIPVDVPFQVNTLVLNGMVYCGGNQLTFSDILVYNPLSGEWSKLPYPDVRGPAMTSLNNQLVLVGGHGGNEDRITVWDSDRNKWVHPYPPMPTGRGLSAAVGYQNYLIVACGWLERDIVDVLDTTSGRWYSAQPIPVGGHHMSSVVVDDHWYLSLNGFWKDGKDHIFWSHIPTLISSATSAHTNTTSIWHELPTPPVDEPSLLALQGHLLLVGGRGYAQKFHRYDPETRQWRECGQLPVGMAGPCCTVLPSGELMVTGGVTEDADFYSKRTWIGTYY